MGVVSLSNLGAQGANNRKTGLQPNSGLVSGVSSIAAIWTDKHGSNWLIIRTTFGKRSQTAWVKCDNDALFADLLAAAIDKGFTLWIEGGTVQSDEYGFFRLADGEKVANLPISLIDGYTVNGVEMSAKCRFVVQSFYKFELDSEFDIENDETELLDYSFKGGGVPFYQDADGNVYLFFVEGRCITTVQQREVKTGNRQNFINQLKAENPDFGFVYDPKQFLDPTDAKSILAENYGVSCPSLEEAIENGEFENVDEMDENMATDAELKPLVLDKATTALQVPAIVKPYKDAGKTALLDGSKLIGNAAKVFAKEIK